MKSILRSFATLSLAAGISAGAVPVKVQVYKTATCGCCAKWVEHLKANGFLVNVENVPSTAEYRKKFGVPDQLASCHTAVAAGYTIEGHVPAADLKRLIKSHSKAKGLAVAGMPSGSPGMEGAKADTFATMVFEKDGKVSVFELHTAH